MTGWLVGWFLNFCYLKQAYMIQVDPAHLESSFLELHGSPAVLTFLSGLILKCCGLPHSLLRSLLTLSQCQPTEIQSEFLVVVLKHQDFFFNVLQIPMCSWEIKLCSSSHPFNNLIHSVILIIILIPTTHKSVSLVPTTFGSQR